MKPQSRSSQQRAQFAAAAQILSRSCVAQFAARARSTDTSRQQAAQSGGGRIGSAGKTVPPQVWPLLKTYFACAHAARPWQRNAGPVAHKAILPAIIPAPACL
jgi:hypothetical protein